MRRVAGRCSVLGGWGRPEARQGEVRALSGEAGRFVQPTVECLQAGTWLPGGGFQELSEFLPSGSFQGQ